MFTNHLCHINKLNNYRLIFLILFYFTIAISKAQTLEWSNTQKLRGHSIYTTIVGEDESGIYLIRHRNKFLSKFIVLERYRHNLGMENSKSFLLKNTRIIYSDLNEEGLLLIKQVYDKKNKAYKIVASLLNNSFENIQPEILITWLVYPIIDDEPLLIIKPSFNHNHYFIFNYGFTKNKQNFNKYTVIDKKINIINSGEFSLDQNLNIEKLENIIIDKNLGFSALYSLKKNKDGLIRLAIYEQGTIKQIVDSSYSFDKPILFYNINTGLKGVTGFYTSNAESGFEGNFSIIWTNFKKDSLIIKKQPFSNSILKELSGEIKVQNGFLPSSYIPIKLVCRSDGGFIKVSENTFIQKEQEITMINGTTSTHGKAIYTFENILIQNFDSTGKLDWENLVTKNQNTVNDGGMLSSAFVSVTESSINLVYNDPIASGGDISLATFLPGGERKIKVVAKGDELNAFIIPAEGKQISSDKIIVPVLKDRKFALLKITFK